MRKSRFPVYEDFIGGVPKFPIHSDVSRFHIDIRRAKYNHLHHHHYAELSYYLDEGGIESINGVNHVLKPGTVSFLLPHHLHVITGDPERRRIRKICCMFELQLLSMNAEKSWFSRQLYGVGISTPSFVDFCGDENIRIKEAFLYLLDEYKKAESPFRLAMIQTKLNEILLLFLREAASQQSSAPQTVHNEDAEHLWPLLKFINNHYMKPLTLKELSAQIGLTEPYISKFFKEHVNMGFIEYLHRLRVERAACMLLHTDLTVTEAALEVGFESVRTFSRVFRDIKGVSAKEYRQSLKR